nr:CheR family methyltransferase [uncultured Pseudomonas sp.]
MPRTEPACSPQLLIALHNKVLRHLGMDFSGPRSADLLRRLHLLAVEQEVVDFDIWLRELAFATWDRSLLQTLIPAFTVGETYFRRDAEAFDWLASHHLGPLLARRRQAGQRSLRLWSAGCCTGEEAYSLLFLVDQLLGAERDSWSLEIVASDLNTAFLAQAEQGLYGANAFRRNENQFRNKYFQAEGRLWRVRPTWSGRIRFIQYNLADGAQPCPMLSADLILCRNVLMYFSASRATAALRRLLASLAPEGLLLLSAVEAGIATQSGLTGRWAGCNYALYSGTLQNRPPQKSVELLRAPLSLTVPPAFSAPSATPLVAPDARLTKQPVAATPNRTEQEEKPIVAPKGIAEGLWHQAQDAFNQGRSAAARDTLLAYLACAGLNHAQQHQACLLLARSWADQQHFDEAQDWLQRALSLDPASATAYWLLAQLAQQSGDQQAALLGLQKCLYLDAGFILAYFLQARLLLAQGQGQAGDKALQVCRQLLESQDREAPVPHGDGISCAQLLRLCEQLQEQRHPCPNP